MGRDALIGLLCFGNTELHRQLTPAGRRRYRVGFSLVWEPTPGKKHKKLTTQLPKEVDVYENPAILLRRAGAGHAGVERMPSRSGGTRWASGILRSRA
jgi:hypothetical protein